MYTYKMINSEDKTNFSIIIIDKPASKSKILFVEKKLQLLRPL